MQSKIFYFFSHFGDKKCQNVCIYRDRKREKKKSEVKSLNNSRRKKTPPRVYDMID